MGYRIISPQYAGIEDISSAYTPDTTQRYPLGTIIEIVDPYRGQMTLVYCKIAATSSVGALKYLASGWVATATTDAAGIGRSLGVTFNATTAANQYGWVVVRAGMFPVRCVASVAVATGLAVNADMAVTYAATKGITGASVVTASATGDSTIAAGKSRTVTGSTILRMQNASAFDYGVFVGQKLTGSGLAALSDIASISPDGSSITVAVAATSTLTTAVTKTLANATLYWNICEFSYPSWKCQIA